jgi:methylenetetrahydrofolate dehydrogenase (NADP+)/methenyltetrahydrofolate cyclohydrolase
MQQEKQAGILDGVKTSTTVIDTVRLAIDRHIDTGGRRPGLAVVLVGTDPASSIYVRAKRRDCERAGIMARDFTCATPQKDLLALIDRLNVDPEVISRQLPLPSHIDETAVTNRTTRLVKT